MNNSEIYKRLYKDYSKKYLNKICKRKVKKIAASNPPAIALVIWENAFMILDI